MPQQYLVGTSFAVPIDTNSPYPNRWRVMQKPLYVDVAATAPQPAPPPHSPAGGQYLVEQRRDAPVDGGRGTRQRVAVNAPRRVP
jgi:hypothetical protein